MSSQPEAALPTHTVYSTTIVENYDGTFGLSPNNIPMRVGDFLQINGDPGEDYDLQVIILVTAGVAGSVNVHS